MTSYYPTSNRTLRDHQKPTEAEESLSQSNAENRLGLGHSNSIAMMYDSGSQAERS